MRRFLAVLLSLLACLLGLPATAHATPAPIGGGSVLFTLGGDLRCTAAFAATGGGYGHLIVGPGCSGVGATNLYSGSNVLVGPVVAETLAYAVVRVTNTAAWTLHGGIDTGSVHHTITSLKTAPVGSSVCLIQRMTGFHCGTVTAVNQTVAYPQGTVTGLSRTNICLEPGLGPIAFISGDRAVGVPFGSGSCSSGGYGYFTPITRILSTYGLALMAG